MLDSQIFNLSSNPIKANFWLTTFAAYELIFTLSFRKYNIKCRENFTLHAFEYILVRCIFNHFRKAKFAEE